MPFWVFFAINVLGFGLVICFLEETYYDRGTPASRQMGNQPEAVGLRVICATHLDRHAGAPLVCC